MPCLSYGTENQSHWTADRRQQRLALEMVRGEEGVWQTAGGGPQDSRHFEEEAGIGVGPENSDRARGTGADGNVARSPRPVAHAADEHRLRFRRGQYRLWQARSEVLDLQRRDESGTRNQTRRHERRRGELILTRT